MPLRGGAMQTRTGILPPKSLLVNDIFASMEGIGVGQFPAFSVG